VPSSVVVRPRIRLQVSAGVATSRFLALRRRCLQLGWRIHATVHGVVMTGLIVLNLLIINLTAENFLGSSSR
jgi:hypothetical protein